MKITVIGQNLEGITSAACYAEIGNHVLLCSLKEHHVKRDISTHPCMQDAGLNGVVNKQIEDGRLAIHPELDVEKFPADLYVISSMQNSNEALQSLMDEIAKDKTCHGVIFTCSIPVGGLDLAVKSGHSPVAYIPEFMREGSALQDFRNPNSLIIGCENDILLLLIQELYKPFMKSHTRVQIMSVKEAEFARFAVSAMLATRVSFMNELANISELLNIDIDVIQKAVGADPRIGDQYLKPGIGFGGRQLAEDLLHITDLENAKPDNAGLLKSVMQINERQKESLFRKVWRYFNGDLHGKTLAIWGGAFKPNSSRIDNAPIIKLIEAFCYQGVILNIYDPGCEKTLKKYIVENGHEANIGTCENPYQALDGAEALLLVTEWREFWIPDYDEIKLRLNQPLIFDGRNIYEPNRMKQRGFQYYGIGRGERV